jgi:putative transposase
MVIEDLKIQKSRTALTLWQLLKLYEIKRSTYYGWFNEVERDKRERRHCRSPLAAEVEAVVKFRGFHREVGYRKLTWLMNDEEVAFLPESTVYQILLKHNLLNGWNQSQNDGTAKEYRHKPTRVHEHWHTDIAYIKVRGVFYFLIMVLDGFSRYVLDWELMPDMLGRSVEDFIQRVKDKYPNATPKLIHDNGSQFISNDFKKLVTELKIQQVFTRRNHPQTNGKAERWNGLVKQEAIRPACPESFQEAWTVIGEYVDLYNNRRLHAGIKFLRPADMFYGRADAILSQRKERIASARAFRLATNNRRELSNFDA